MTWIVKLGGPGCNGIVSSVQAGNWNDPATWSCGQIPAVTDTVHVKHELVLPPNYVANAYRIIYDLPVQVKLENGSRLQLGQ